MRSLDYSRDDDHRNLEWFDRITDEDMEVCAMCGDPIPADRRTSNYCCAECAIDAENDR